MTSVRFLGDLPLWAGALLALLAGLVAWRYYRRESHDLPGRLRWFLPLLRALAVLLAVMTLTGPVLHHRQVIGQLGRVLVFLDTSASMEARDPQMPVARKLLIAQRQGWLPDGQVDMSLWEIADQLAEARRAVAAQLKGQSVDDTILARCRDSFAESLAEIGKRIESYDWGALSTGGQDQAWDEVHPHFREQLVQPAHALLAVSLTDTQVREDTVHRLLGLCETTVQFEQGLLAAFDTYGSQLAASGNQSLCSALALFDETSRWRRAEGSLLDSSSGLLARLADTHEIELFGLSGPEAQSLWDQRASHPLPTELAGKPTGRTTDLASGIAGVLKVGTASEQLPNPPAGAGQRTAAILVSDGRHNSGASPVQSARVLGGQAIPLYTVGLGARNEPLDLAILGCEHPDLVFQKDRVHGSVLIKDQMPAGRSFVVQIGHQDEVLWQERLTTQDMPLRRVDFELSVDALVEKLQAELDTQLRHHALPIALRVSIAPLGGETDTDNNERAMRFSAITQSYRLLLVDGRSRWETRYLRNVFQRDEQWQVDTILVGPATDQATMPRGQPRNSFPTEQAALFAYDLIILGEVPPGTLTDYEQAWLRQFVELRGGGIILVDGLRGHLRQLDQETLAPLVPVAWRPGNVDSVPTRLQLTDAGAGQSALMLRSTDVANRRFWQELPAPHRVVPVEALPGTEVLAEALVANDALPVIVTRSFGAGRVLYFAFDETWRWRYKAADRYHQRFWNQVAKWVMPRPFAVSSELVALDSGPPSYDHGETAEIRARLRGVDGRPVNDATVDALLWQQGRVVATVSLAAEGSGQGTYRGRTGPLGKGNYDVTVRASGFSSDALKARTSFVVLPREDQEMQRVSCNEDLLREMALASGGQFLREEQMSQLEQWLRPLSSGRVIESDTLLWQSYWWFAAIVGLLTVEWMLRKRAGLL